MRVVLDTNVLARALVGPAGPAAELLVRCTRPPQLLVVSPFILIELSRVLRYDRLRQIHGRTDQQLDEFLQDIQRVSLVVLPPQLTFSVVTRDPDDDPVVQTAISAQADVLCTRDRHLHDHAVVEYCHGHGVQVLDDIQLLARLRQANF